MQNLLIRKLQRIKWQQLLASLNIGADMALLVMRAVICFAFLIPVLGVIRANHSSLLINSVCHPQVAKSGVEKFHLVRRIITIGIRKARDKALNMNAGWEIHWLYSKTCVVNKLIRIIHFIRPLH